MAKLEIRDARETDFNTILELNSIEVQLTSEMDLARLQHLHGLAGYHRVAGVGGQVAAFALAIRSGAPYVNDNFSWFAGRMENFMYVDRIVVGSNFAGLGIGSALYRDLFAHCRVAGIGTVTCEYNIEPPNVASRRFHDKFGFRELGTRHVAGGRKRVSLQAALI